MTAPNAAPLTVGQALGIRPEGEGPAPMLTGGGFEVFFFYAGLHAQEIQGFATGNLACGVYVEDAVPVLVLDIEGFGGLDVAFNIYAEPEDKRQAFFETQPSLGAARIILCDHPQAVVRAIRTIRPGAETIAAIKTACFDQLSLYHNLSDCFAAMTRLYNAISPEDIRERTPMRPA